MNYHWNWLIFWAEAPDGTGTYLHTLIRGMYWTISLSILAWIIALVIGVLVGVARTLKIGWLERLCAGYVELFRNIPLLVQMFLWYFVFPDLLPTSLGSLIRGEPLDNQTSDRLMTLVREGVLPFHSVTSSGEKVPPPGPEATCSAGQFPSPDALLTVSNIMRAIADPDIRIEPAWKASLVYGMPCAVYHQFPAAYYLAGRFQEDFESAVLHAVNGGGQNQARAILTGALSGAIGGIRAIPQRFLDGLEHSKERQAMALRLAQQAAADR